MKKTQSIENCLLQKETHTFDDAVTLVCQGKHEALVRWLEKTGRPADGCLADGGTLLHAAAVFGQTQVAEALLARRANVDKVDSACLTALHLAANEGHVDVARLLLRKGASIFSRNEDTSIKLGGSIPIYSAGGMTPLHFAAESGSTAVLALLLQCPDCESIRNATDNGGNTPLRLAQIGGHDEAAKLLDPLAQGLDKAERSRIKKENYRLLAQRMTLDPLSRLLARPPPPTWTPVDKELYSLSDTSALEFLHPHLLAAWRKATHPNSNNDSDHDSDSASCPPLMKMLAEGVYVFPLLSPSFCSRFMDELDAYERDAAVRGLPVRRPNSMNRYGVVVNDFGFTALIQKLMDQYLQPLLNPLFPAIFNLKNSKKPSPGGEEACAPNTPFSSHHSFSIRYEVGQDVSLATHVDSSDLTVNVCLGAQFVGGQLYFHGLRGGTAPQQQQRQHPDNCDQCLVRHTHLPGYAVVHVGKHIHGATPLREGLRSNLVMWFRH